MLVQCLTTPGRAPYAVCPRLDGAYTDLGASARSSSLHWVFCIVSGRRRRMLQSVVMSLLDLSNTSLRRAEFARWQSQDSEWIRLPNTIVP